MTTLGQVLARARQAKGVGLRDVERATGVSNPYLSQLETGRIKEPSPHKLMALAVYYGLDYAYLWEAAGYPPVESLQPTYRTFLGQELTDEELEAMIAFLRAYREVRGG